MVARAELSLPRHSRLSMIERPTAGATGGGGRDGATGFFPFSFFGDMAAGGREEVRDGIGSKGQSSGGGRAGDGQATVKGGGCVQLWGNLAQRRIRERG